MEGQTVFVPGPGELEQNEYVSGETVSEALGVCSRTRSMLAYGWLCVVQDAVGLL